MPNRPSTRRRPIAAGLAASLFISSLMPLGIAHAQSSARFMTAGELHQRLSAAEPAAREAGRHYVLGVVDALALARDSRLCLGPGVPASELIDAVASALTQRPDLHRYNAASLVREAIATAFPCV